MEFIDAHYHANEGPTLRDGMDQRVFNKFVMAKMESNPPQVVKHGHVSVRERQMFS